MENVIARETACTRVTTPTIRSSSDIMGDVVRKCQDYAEHATDNFLNDRAHSYTADPGKSIIGILKLYGPAATVDFVMQPAARPESRPIEVREAKQVFPRTKAVFPLVEEDRYFWDAALQVPTPKRRGVINATLVFKGRRKPPPAEDPFAD